VKITEQLVVLCDSGTSSLSSAELRGVMKVNFPANIDPFVGIQVCPYHVISVYAKFASQHYYSVDGFI
jgi:hypothetical protein